MNDDRIDLEHYRRRLLELRRELVEERREGDAASRTVELDQSRFGRLSRMDALQAQAMSVAAQSRRTEHLHEIDAALARIDEGEYGDCVECGEEIASRRLDFDPAAALCIGCASKHEQ
jgi:DnaK suppressor protein